MVLDSFLNERLSLNPCSTDTRREQRNIASADIIEWPLESISYGMDKILKGANPGVLPVEPSQLELVLNHKTARKIGLKIPPEILLEANEIIR